ncbi:P2X purinoceptor 4-like isoform X2 [Lampetra planeri]
MEWMRNARPKVKNVFIRYDLAQTVEYECSWLKPAKYVALAVIIIAYYFIYVVGFEHAYREYEDVTSAVRVKVKGTAKVDIPNEGVRTFDSADYVVPDQKVSVSPCQNDGDCTRDVSKHLGSGIQTGRCVHYDATWKSCEVMGWCPVERRTSPPQPPLLPATENATVYIQNHVYFIKNNKERENFPLNLEDKDLSSCRYHPRDDPSCPIFRLGDITAMAGHSFSSMSVQGGIIAIVISWDCKLSEAECFPAYSFHRLDRNYTTKRGYNFRYSVKSMETNVQTRTLVKAFGIRFNILVTGQGWKVSPLPTLLYLSSAFTFCSMFAIFFNLFAIWYLKKNNCKVVDKSVDPKTSNGNGPEIERLQNAV